MRDLQATLTDLGQRYDLGEGYGWLQEYCPACKRVLRGQAYDPACSGAGSCSPAEDRRPTRHATRQEGLAGPSHCRRARGERSIMSVNKDVFHRRELDYDFQSAGAPVTGWAGADRLPESLVPTHCCFCGVQCGMHLRVAGGRVTGVEPRDFPHNQGHLCPKGIVAHQQVHHPERLQYPLIRRGGEGATWSAPPGKRPSTTSPCAGGRSRPSTARTPSASTAAPP